MKSGDEIADNEIADRLSNLPEDVLLEIFSHLSLKECVASSILSTTWTTLYQAIIYYTILILLTLTTLYRRYLDFGISKQGSHCMCILALHFSSCLQKWGLFKVMYFQKHKKKKKTINGQREYQLYKIGCCLYMKSVCISH